MPKFSFNIITGSTVDACQAAYDGIASKDLNCFYLFNQGGIGYFGETLLFGGDADTFNIVSANTTISKPRVDKFYFVTADCTLTDGQATPETHTAKTGSIWLASSSDGSLSELSHEIFTTYMANYIATAAIKSTDLASATLADTSIMTSKAIEDYVESQINAQNILDTAFFAGVETHVISAAEIAACEMTVFGNHTLEIVNNDGTPTTEHEGDIVLVFKLQAGDTFDETTDTDDTFTYVNLHSLINLYSIDNTAQTTQMSMAPDGDHGTKIKVEVNTTSMTTSAYADAVKAAADDIADGQSYNASSDNLGNTKFVTEGQLAEILAKVLANYIPYETTTTTNDNQP